MDYVLLVEPDMYPVASSFNRAALQQREVVYAIHRSGKESLGEVLSFFQQNRHQEALEEALRAEGLGRPQLRLFMEPWRKQNDFHCRSEKFIGQELAPAKNGGNRFSTNLDQGQRASSRPLAKGTLDDIGMGMLRPIVRTALRFVTFRSVICGRALNLGSRWTLLAKLEHKTCGVQIMSRRSCLADRVPGEPESLK
eukprot:Skav225661  [mRNA]  locus=scaffold1924:21515:24455:+ [translate_table: standard]